MELSYLTPHLTDSYLQERGRTLSSGGAAFLLPNRQRESPLLHLCYLGDQQRLLPGMCKTNNDILLDGQRGGHHPYRGTGFKILNRLINRCSSFCKALISRPYGLKFISPSCLLAHQYFQELSQSTLFRKCLFLIFSNHQLLGYMQCLCVCQ